MSKGKADEVFEFLDSLPDKGEQGGDVEEGEDIMEFLDELEKSNLQLKKEGAAKAPDAKAEKEVAPVPAPQPVAEAAVKGETPADVAEGEGAIASLSSWWSSSGSATVSSLWNKTQEQASQLQKAVLDENQLPIKDLTALRSKINANTITSTINANANALTSKLNAETLAGLASRLQEIVIGETEEVLRIHLVHDLVNYPLLQYQVEQKFHGVMANQVQGGIRIFVDEWANPNETGAEEYEFDKTAPINLNIFTGKLVDGEKLALANLDNATKLYSKLRQGIESQKKKTETTTESAETETASQDSEDNISDLFISILPVASPASNDSDEIKTTDNASPGNFCFVLILKDITNNITTITRSQGFPTKWANWLSNPAEQEKEKPEQDKPKDQETEEADTVVNPSEWVSPWIEDGLNLAFGIAAQNYVMDRMGL